MSDDQKKNKQAAIVHGLSAMERRLRNPKPPGRRSARFKQCAELTEQLIRDLGSDASTVQRLEVERYAYEETYLRAIYTECENTPLIVEGLSGPQIHPVHQFRIVAGKAQMARAALLFPGLKRTARELDVDPNEKARQHQEAEEAEISSGQDSPESTDEDRNKENHS